MKKTLFLPLTCLFLMQSAFAQESKEARDKRMQWWREARFGIFIHWDPAQMTKTMDEYIDQVAIPQVRELMTNYGDVAVFWWDTPTNMTDEYALKLQALLKR
jgi:hypothetical protein